jgi:hypothetical protein
MNPDPYTAWSVVLTIGVLVSISVNLVTLAKMGKAQKREVTFGEETVTKEMCTATRSAISDRIGKLELHEADNQRKASDSRAALYDKIDAVRSELSAKIESMPAQIIVILKNTGAIK